MLISLLMIHKIVTVPIIGVCSAGVFIIPLTFIIVDISTEVYGYKASKKLLWSSMITLAFFCIIAAILLHLPSPTKWNYWNKTVDQTAYNFVFFHIIRNYFSVFIALAIGSFINAFVIARWRVLLNGKYFWLRSIGSSCIGELIFTLIGIIFVVIGTENFLQILEIIAFSFIVKMIFNVIFATPAVFVVRVLRISENINPNDYEVVKNPFK